jgi:hypothetical protein
MMRALLALALAGLGPGAAHGQVLPDPLPPSNPAPIGYCPPERLAAGAPSPYHVLNVFLPRGTVPAAGWPVVLSTGYGGAASVPPISSLRSLGATRPFWELVAKGIAVVHYGTPGLGGTRGMWYPAGHPSGRYESFRPIDDNPEKSAEWALQWLKVQTLYRFDLQRIGLRGSSGGAVLAIRTAMGPDRARASGSAQVRASTRVAAILAIQPPTSAWALEQGPELTIPFPRHLEQALQPGVPALRLEQVAPELQKDYSLMRAAFATAEARENNARQPICLVYGDPVLRIGGDVAPFDLDASGFPIVHDRILQPLQHDSWFGYVFWKRLIELSPASAAFHAAHSVFAMRRETALAPPLALHTQTFAGTVHGPGAIAVGNQWLIGRLLGPVALQVTAAQGSGLPGEGGELLRTGLAAGGGLRIGLCARPEDGAVLLFGGVGAGGRSPGRCLGLRRLAPDGGPWTELGLRGAAQDGPVWIRALVLGAEGPRWTDPLRLRGR